MSVTCYLLLLSQVSSIAMEITERRLAVEGSSVMMHAPAISNMNLTDWEYIRDSTPEFILQYYANSQSPTIYPAYEGRVDFYPKNGSLLLHQVRELDSGTYRSTVDLMQDKARTTILKVIKPVPQPKLLSSSNLAGSLIELTCMLPEGTPAAVSWKKDGRPLSPEECYQLCLNNTTLQIRGAEKSDCGSYSCNISNAVSWEEATYNLTVTGLSPPLRAAQRTTAAALVLAVIAAISFLIWILQPGKHGLGKEARRWLTLPIKGLLGTSSLLLLVASIICMQEEGPSAAFILFGLYLLAAIVTMALTAVIPQRRLTALTCCPAQICHHVILCNTATTLAVNLSFSSLLLHNFHQLHKRGCSEAVDVTISCILSALAALLLLLLFFLWDHKKEKKMDVMHSTPTTSTHVKEEGPGKKQDEESRLSLQHPGADIVLEPG